MGQRKLKSLLKTLPAFAAIVAVAMVVRAVDFEFSSDNFDMDEVSTPGAAGGSFSDNFHLAAVAPESAGDDEIGESTNFRLETALVPDSFEPDDTDPPVITAGPTVLYVGDDRALIEWETDELANSLVEYGLTTGYGEDVFVSGFRTLHQVLVTGLDADTTYQFRVGSTDPFGNGPTFSANDEFTTLAAPDMAEPVITPDVTILGVTRARIDFTTDKAATTDFLHGPVSPPSIALPPDDVFRTDHTRTLDGLTANSTHFYDITATDPSGNVGDTGPRMITLPPAVNISTTVLINGTLGQPYPPDGAPPIQATGGVGALTFAIVGGGLPQGLTLDAETGVVSGIPEQAGPFAVTIRATDSGTPVSQHERAMSINISEPPPRKKSDSGCSTGEKGDPMLLLAGLAALLALALRLRPAGRASR